MRVTPERLRKAIVALAALLALVIAGSFLYGRWRMQHLAQDLPSRLNVTIKQSTQGFVLSKTEQGRPVFTLHAARALEFRSDGHYSLHDVKIDLYNRSDNQADTIAGKDFEYDPRRQVVEARGEAHLVLHAPPRSASGKTGNSEPGQRMQVTTHDLVFHQKTGVATCQGEVEFDLGDWSGRATGAQYDSKQGHLVLSSDLVITSHIPNHPSVELKAARAIYEQSPSQIQLWQPRYRSGAQGGGMQAASETATLLLRSNGSAEQMNAKGDVRLAFSNGLRVRAPAMKILVREDNRPQKAKLSGGVHFENNQPERKSSGTAQQVQIAFGGQGRARMMTLDGGVLLKQQAGSKKNLLQRSVHAQHLVLHFHSPRDGQPQLRLAEASGSAIFTSESAPPGRAPQKTTLAAQSLTAKFAAAGDSRTRSSGRRPESARSSAPAQLEQVDGKGQTRIETVAANGDLDTSTGDSLQVLFAPASRGGNGKDASGDDTVRMATQAGHVVFEQTGKATGPGAARPLLATMTAERDRYTASNHTLTLTGTPRFPPRFRNDRIEMTADRIAFDRREGKATLTGSVQATMHSGEEAPGSRSSTGLLGASQPVHIIAARAVLVRGSENAVFSGGARLWRGGDSIAAPQIELSRKMKILKAYSRTPCKDCILATLTTASSPPATKTKQAPESAPSTFRILSQSLVYSDAEHKASFLRHVQVTASNGQLTADQAEFFLAAARSGAAAHSRSPAKATAAPTSVEKMIASGNVRLLQPGRIATGSRLAYSAADGDFVLTGEPANPPKVVDVDRGTVTGEKLIFDSRTRAIMVSGSPGHRATTTTRAQTE